MTEHLPPQALLLQAAEQKQRLAFDPTVCAWVRANAGTGKTHVLVQRILCLLLSGADPRSILCLTFTKNAAAEMEARVLGKLAEWATADDESLAAHLERLLARPPSEAELAIGRCLFTTIIDTPGGLGVMTIHGFCERLLRRYAFEAGVAPGFGVLTEEEARGALQEATSGALASPAESALGQALSTIVAYAHEDEFSRVLGAMLAKRNSLRHLFRISNADDPAAYIADRLRGILALDPADNARALIEQSSSILDRHALEQIVSALAGGTQTDLDGKARFEAVLKAENGEPKCAALRSVFYAKGGEARKSLMTVAIRKRFEALHDRLIEAQRTFLALDRKLLGLKALEATTALMRLTAAIFERYEAEKNLRAALDFDDLIDKTLSLLSRPQASDWVLYELDARIDHILVDEAQDTSPEQWAILERLTSDFFSGQGARDCSPTMFAVGDEKQSIYGFQGAVPELLEHFGTFYERRASEARLAWRAVDLNLSFRTLDPILKAVDAVARNLPGFRDGRLVPHLAYRRDGGGLVELWEPERGEKEEKGTVWESEPQNLPRLRPAQALAERIAAQIKHWLESAERLRSERVIEPGDILILLRKREPMARALQGALKRAGIAVAGADRVALLDELAIMDLLALADVLLQPEDDLALASVLRSPLFGLTEDNLFALAFNRPASLWRALEAAGQKADPAFASATGKLAAWQDLAHDLSPFDFFAHILEAEGGRKAFAGRLGLDCFDALDEFLALAETFSCRPLATLSEFVAFARNSASEVKRETDQAVGEVRVMTVHGAKGLEANIVILADSCSNRGGGQPSIFFLDDDGGAPPAPIWAIKGSAGLQPVAEAKAAAMEAERQEMERLLYVAMTRARDRLYVTGFHSGPLPEGCWYDTIKTALAPNLREENDFTGRTVLRMGALEPSPAASGAAEESPKASPPPYLSTLVRKETVRPILSPSRLGDWADGAPNEGRALGKSDRETAQTAGTLVHRLLEVLPEVEARNRLKVASLIGSAFSRELTARHRQEAIARALELASNVEAVKQGQVLHEAGLAVTVRSREGKIAAIIGQADRILFSGSQISILDYKSGDTIEDGKIRRGHLAQLAAYWHALQRLYPEANVEAGLLNARSKSISKASHSALEDMLAAILNSLHSL